MGTRTPEYALADIVKPFAGFETKYQGLNTQTNPIAIPGSLDAFAGTEGYDPNLLAGIPVPMGAKIYVWLPRYFPSEYAPSAPNYRYRFVWRLRSLSEQVADKTRKRASHFGRLLKGVAQMISAGPNTNLNPTAGPRFVIPAAFESVQIINNKFFIATVGGTDQPIQHGTISAAGVPLGEVEQDPADIAVVVARTNTYLNGSDQYQAPISPNFPGPNAPGDPKSGAAGLLSQGYYPDQAGWAIGTPSEANQGYSAGGQYVIYETEVKGDELIILLDRVSSEESPTWDFEGLDRNVSRILGTDAGTRAALPTLGVYLLTGSGVAGGQSYG